MTTNTALDWIPPGTFGPDDISEQLELDLTEEKGPERPVGHGEVEQRAQPDHRAAVPQGPLAQPPQADCLGDRPKPSNHRELRLGTVPRHPRKRSVAPRHQGEK